MRVLASSVAFVLLKADLSSNPNGTATTRLAPLPPRLSRTLRTPEETGARETNLTSESPRKLSTAYLRWRLPCGIRKQPEPKSATALQVRRNMSPGSLSAVAVERQWPRKGLLHALPVVSKGTLRANVRSGSGTMTGADLDFILFQPVQLPTSPRMAQGCLVLWLCRHRWSCLPRFRRCPPGSALSQNYHGGARSLPMYLDSCDWGGRCSSHQRYNRSLGSPPNPEILGGFAPWTYSGPRLSTRRCSSGMLRYLSFEPSKPIIPTHREKHVFWAASAGVDPDAVEVVPMRRSARPSHPAQVRCSWKNLARVEASLNDVGCDCCPGVQPLQAQSFYPGSERDGHPTRIFCHYHDR